MYAFFRTRSIALCTLVVATLFQTADASQTPTSGQSSVVGSIIQSVGDSLVKLDCQVPQVGSFDSVRQYTCAYNDFRDESIVLADETKMKDFDALWNPAIWIHSPDLQMSGVSEKDRMAQTFSLIRRMRDFTHERFDYVQDSEQLADEDKTDIHPVLAGGIGVQTMLDGQWMISKELKDSEPKGGYPSEAAYQAKEDALEIVSATHRIIVEAATQDGPSDGLFKHGDFIDSIDGVKLDGKAYSKVVSDMIRGTPSTPIVVGILRKDEKSGNLVSLTFHLVRQQVQERAVTVVDDGGVRYITVENFMNAHLLSDFHRALVGAQAGHMKGIVIDLRGNPGGYLPYAIAMMEMVVPRGLILSSRQREEGAAGILQTDYMMEDDIGVVSQETVGAPVSEKKVSYSERVPFTKEYADKIGGDEEYVGENPLQSVIPADMPVVVMVNVNSYSAAEIFAGGIQATHRGSVVGMPTAGKGAIMTQMHLPEGGAVSVTSGQFYPGGIDTKYKGILPDYEVDRAADYGKTDLQKDKAGEVIEAAYKRLQAFKVEADARTTINKARFEAEMSERDANDKKSAKTQNSDLQE